MANNQPLNTEISVKNRVRSQRVLPSSAQTVKAVANRMLPLVMSVVGREVGIGRTRDNPPETGVTTTALLFGRDSGLPLVTYIQPTMPFAALDSSGNPIGAANEMYAAGQADIPVVIGQDKFLQPVDGSEGEDIQADERAVSVGPTYTP